MLKAEFGENPCSIKETAKVLQASETAWNDEESCQVLTSAWTTYEQIQKMFVWTLSHFLMSPRHLIIDFNDFYPERQWWLWWGRAQMINVFVNKDTQQRRKTSKSFLPPKEILINGQKENMELLAKAEKCLCIPESSERDHWESKACGYEGKWAIDSPDMLNRFKSDRFGSRADLFDFKR